MAVTHGWLTEHGKQAAVKLLYPLVDGFFRTAYEVGRDAFQPAFELPLMEETQARRQKRDDRRGLVNFRRERRRRPWLIVVFEKAGQFVLIVHTGVEVLAHGRCMALTQAVVQPLVIGVIEALLLQRPFQVPVDLGHEEKVRKLLPHALGRLGPEEGTRLPQVRSKMSGKISMAMSQRTPSHCPAIFTNSPIIASCVAGLA